MPSFEFPFNERIRTYLRLEDLFSKVLHHIEIGHEFSHHAAVVSLLQMLDVIDRADLKVELLQELDRQKNHLIALRGKANIDQETLEQTIIGLEKSAIALRSDNQKIGQTLRENDWLMSVKQRVNIPGGVCEFDLPSYHHWLGLGEAKRKADFNLWLSRLMPMYYAIRAILQILRGCSQVTQQVAVHGAYQQQLNGARPVQLLRIELDSQVGFPEVSANKYAINIRFNGLDNAQRPKQLDVDVPFTMYLCNFSGISNF